MRNDGKRGDRKKLSWIYRKKTKAQKAKKVTQDAENAQIQNKKARIIVRNLPFKATEEDIKKFYEPFGQIEEVNLPQRPDGKLLGCGFVQFKHVEDASKAIFNTNKKEFLGRVISSSWAIPKSKFVEKLEKSAQETETSVGHENDESKVADEDNSKIEETEKEREKKVFPKKESPEIKQQKKKLQKEMNRKKRARIVIRNLAFQATEEHLREHFSQYGAIEEIQILTRSDGKNVGCAFVQFELVQSAAKAIHYANLKPLLNRPIIIDWAVSKNKFSNNKSSEEEARTVEVKEENDSDAIAEEPCSSKGSTAKTNDASPEESGSDNEEGTVHSKESDESDDDVSMEETREIEADEDDVKDIKEEASEKEEKRPRYMSHDVSEGKTVFLKNIPFSVKNDQLKQCMEQFGPVYYALVCMDPLTEYSKGTGFVKFRNIEDAEKCLSAGNELRIDDQILEAHRALDKKEIENKGNLKRQRERDTRNLYLVKEGVVLAGSPAAVGVSAADMAKRLQLEQWKSQILRNLNMFVSRVRLVIHNLPVSMDDEKLRKIVEKHCGPNAIIREARVMRNMRDVDAEGVGKSKEYGFVSFTTHEDALKVLRSMNNNPNVFSRNRRPIVSFSIENRIMVNAKQKRIQKSREHNPLWPGNKMKRKGNGENDEVPVKKSKTDRMDDNEDKPYAGIIGKPGESKLRSKFNLKNQAALHHQSMKKEKKKNKTAKKLQVKKREEASSRNEVKTKQGTKMDPDDEHFNKLVNSYKNKLQSIGTKRSKWYETQ